MDRKIVKPKSMKMPLTVLFGMLASVIAYWSLVPANGKVLKQDTARLNIAEVQRGQFEDFIPLRGQFKPASTVYLDTLVGGRIENIYVEDGELVEAGQLLLELSNTNMQIDVLANETRVTEQLNNLHQQQLQLEQNRLQHQRKLVETNYQIVLHKSKVERLKPLVESSVVAKAELEDAINALEYYQALRKISLHSQRSDLAMQEDQLKQLQQSALHLQQGLKIAQNNLENLKIRAPVSGKLTEFDAELGQSFSPGQRLGKIDDPKDYKVSALVDEYYLSRVVLDQQATSTINGEEIKLTIKKTYPQVNNGRFEVDLVFDSEMPGSIRSGQAIQLKLFLGDSEDVLLIPYGSFYADTGGDWLFVVGQENDKAMRRNVRLGRRNTNVIEVLEGLQEGEKVIVSPYTDYLDKDRLELRDSGVF